MRDESLYLLMKRIDEDDTFREKIRDDPFKAIAIIDEQAANEISETLQEDGLRRLAYRAAGTEKAWWSKVKRFFSRLFCGPGGTRSWQCRNAPSDPPS